MWKFGNTPTPIWKDRVRDIYVLSVGNVLVFVQTGLMIKTEKNYASEASS